MARDRCAAPLFDKLFIAGDYAAAAFDTGLCVFRADSGLGREPFSALARARLRGGRRSLGYPWRTLPVARLIGDASMEESTVRRPVDVFGNRLIFSQRVRSAPAPRLGLLARSAASNALAAHSLAASGSSKISSGAV